MAVTICPTVTTTNLEEFHQQMKVASGIARRVHIDLMDGDFAPTRSPGLENISWPASVIADIHLMYRDPMNYLDQLIQLKPHMVIIHNEATVHHMHFAAELHKNNIKTGLALLQDTPVDFAEQIMHSFDQILIFSGHLGYHGGVTDLSLLNKVQQIKVHHPDVEVAWDGGINDQNAESLIAGGVDVLNVGGFIQKAEDPQSAYAKLLTIAES